MNSGHLHVRITNRDYDRARDIRTRLEELFANEFPDVAAVLEVTLADVPRPAPGRRGRPPSPSPA